MLDLHDLALVTEVLFVSDEDSISVVTLVVSLKEVDFVSILPLLLTYTIFYSIHCRLFYVIKLCAIFIRFAFKIVVKVNKYVFANIFFSKRSYAFLVDSILLHIRVFT